MTLAGEDQAWNPSPDILLDYLVSKIIEGVEEVPESIRFAVCDRLLFRQIEPESDQWERWFQLSDEFSPYPSDRSFRELLDEEYVR